MLELEWVNLNRKSNGEPQDIGYISGELFGAGGLTATPLAFFRCIRTAMGLPVSRSVTLIVSCSFAAAGCARKPTNDNTIASNAIAE